MKKNLALAVQALVSIGLIVWIFRDPEQRANMAQALQSANLAWFVPGVAAVGFALILQTIRWQVLLRAIDIRLTWRRCGQLFMIGNFFNLFLLGATGGDVAKIYFTMKESPDAKAGAFLSIVVDRIAGVLALAAVAVVVIALRFDAFMKTAVGQAMLGTLGIILGAIVGVIVLGALVAIFRLQDRLPQKMPLRRPIVDLAQATTTYSRKPGALGIAYLLSIPGHLLIFASFYFAARALNVDLGLLDTFSVMPIVNTLASMPISLSGIGVREHAFEQLLASLYGIASAQAVLISILGYLMSIFWGLIGGIVFLTYRTASGSPASLKEISGTVTTGGNVQ